MADADFQRVKEALSRARALAPPERHALLDGLLADDAALHAEVVSLLAQDGPSGAPLTTGAFAGELGAALASAVAPPAFPERVGPFRILEILGEGGMGVVYRAEQDAPLRREVAVKLMRAGLDTTRVVARFDSERQALALMDHACIARVFDAGVDGTGRPYFAMELVQGTRITTYCDAHRLDVRRRIELFLGVCDAVQHAHRRGVIHRDLKPANVLVEEEDGAPVPKVIDFGIAKAIWGPGGDRPQVTEDGQLLGTPEYMSPEQAGGLGAAVDARTDVYSLGVMLYEILTGSRPYDFAPPRQGAVTRAPVDADPSRPSARASRLAPESPLAAAQGGPERVRRKLSGDLDLVLLKALSRDPDRRYCSVEELAADLRRQLVGHRVSARPDSLRYRGSRYVARHRSSVAVVGAVTLLAAATAVTLAFMLAEAAAQRDRAREAERRARVEAQRARAAAAAAADVSRFLASLFRSDPGEPLERVTAGRMLERGAARVEAGLWDEPAARARLLAVLGDIYGDMGVPDRSLALHARALKLRQGLRRGSGAGTSSRGENLPPLLEGR